VRLSEIGELGLLAELERRGLARDIANDAAHLEGGLVVTQDALVEDVHFKRPWISWRDLGFRAAAVNLSDLAASGAGPEGLIVSLGLPGDTHLDDVLELYAGISETGVPVIGGDTTAAERVYLSVTAVGRSARVPGRAGAKPGDLIVVTGPLGAAGAAFRENRFVRPPVRLEEGRRLAQTAHAPLAEGATLDDLRFGEDYELLAAVPHEVFHVIGRCEPGEGVELLRYGVPVELGGWEHFA
jgi:thiamine-monophosphate kinase